MPLLAPTVWVQEGMWALGPSCHWDWSVLGRMLTYHTTKALGLLPALQKREVKKTKLYNLNGNLFVFFFSSALGINPRASSMLSKHSATGLHSQPFAFNY
jgi:hypothetical protein